LDRIPEFEAGREQNVGAVAARLEGSRREIGIPADDGGEHAMGRVRGVRDDITIDAVALESNTAVLEVFQHHLPLRVKDRQFVRIR
jgi:hypothetical protein